MTADVPSGSNFLVALQVTQGLALQVFELQLTASL
jgi:hypothetical protein